MGNIIENEVNKLIKKYKTTNPYEICDAKNITYKKIDLHPEINGIYQYIERNKFIYINSQLSDNKQLFTCGHELGHAIIHEKYNCTFLKTQTYFNVNRFEKEADIFASCLLIPDVSVLNEFNELSMKEIACELNVPIEYLKLRIDYCKSNFS